MRRLSTKAEACLALDQTGSFSELLKTVNPTQPHDDLDILRFLFEPLVDGTISLATIIASQESYTHFAHDLFSFCKQCCEKQAMNLIAFLLLSFNGLNFGMSIAAASPKNTNSLQGYFALLETLLTKRDFFQYVMALLQQQDNEGWNFGMFIARYQNAANIQCYLALLEALLKQGAPAQAVMKLLQQQNKNDENLEIIIQSKHPNYIQEVYLLLLKAIPMSSTSNLKQIFRSDETNIRLFVRRMISTQVDNSIESNKEKKFCEILCEIPNDILRKQVYEIYEDFMSLTLSSLPADYRKIQRIHDAMHSYDLNFNQAYTYIQHAHLIQIFNKIKDSVNPSDFGCLPSELREKIYYEWVGLKAEEWSSLQEKTETLFPIIVKVNTESQKIYEAMGFFRTTKHRDYFEKFIRKHTKSLATSIYKDDVQRIKSAVYFFAATTEAAKYYGVFERTCLRTKLLEIAEEIRASQTCPDLQPIP